MDLNKMYESWKAAFLQPEKVLAASRKKASLEEGAKQLAIGLVVAGVISGIITTIYTLGIGVASIVLTPIGMLIGGLICYLVANAVFWVIAKVLGGKGGYGQQFHLSALMVVPVVVINAILGIIPVLGGLVGLLVSLYGIWLQILAVKEAHAFSTERAAVAVLLPIVVLGLLVAIFAVMFAAVLGAVGLAGLAAALGTMPKA